MASFLTVVLDWATRHVLACGWRIASAPMSAVAAVEEAIAKYGAPETMNTDGGSQFTSGDVIGVVQRHAIVIDVLFPRVEARLRFRHPAWPEPVDQHPKAVRCGGWLVGSLAW